MDIVKRLRLGDFSPFSGEYIKDADKDEAAEEIERLREALKEIKRHLETGYRYPDHNFMLKMAKLGLGEKE